jgi:hypothetical protein
MDIDKKTNWEKCKTNVFWGEIAPCDHVVQIYEHDDAFLDTLADFVSDGFYSNDCTIVIGSRAHLDALELRLRSSPFDLHSLISNESYIPLDAQESLSKFMVNEWPDETLFTSFVSDLVLKAKKNGRQVRAFGEMVAILWEQGHTGATVQLEHLWNKFCSSEAFCLFCAYPKIGFTQDANSSLLDICAAHSKIIAGSRNSTYEIKYKAVS